MANYVDVPLDKNRRIRFTINGIRELERHFGSTFSRIFAEGNLGFEQIIMLLTIGLKYGDPDTKPLSDTRVGELVQRKWLENGKPLSDLVKYIVDAMNASGIVSLDKEEEEEPKERRSPSEIPND